jgi:hypothetical protein
MISTIIAVLLAILFNLFPGTAETPQSATLSLLFTVTGLLLIVIFVAINGMVIMPLQRAENRSMPRVVEMFRKDSRINMINISLLGFALLNLLHVYDPTILHNNLRILFSIWLVLLGISLDMLHAFFKESLGYLNPSTVIGHMTEQAKKSILSEKYDEFCSWIESLTEIGIRAIDRNSISLSCEVVQELQKVTRFFMESCKSISHISPTVTREEPKSTDVEQTLGKDADEVSFMLYFITQRLEYMFIRALQNNLKTTCSTLISAMGKIILASAKFDLTLVSNPVHLLGQFAHKAQEAGYPELSDQATFTLVEISKTILSEIDFTYSNLKDPFLTIVTNLDEIAKETFRKDKSISIAILIQPIRDLKALFSQEKLANHQDTPAILSNINRIIGEWEAVDNVMKSMPPINKITEGLIADLG